MDRQLIKNLIAKHEGRRNAAYADTRGIMTVGIGWNLEDPESQDIADHFGISLNAIKSRTVSLTDAQIDQVFDYQITRTISDAMSIFPNFNQMPDTVQAVVCDMLFNLGKTRFMKFVSTIAVLKKGDWKQAAIDAKASLWAKQVPARAAEDIALLNAV